MGLTHLLIGLVEGFFTAGVQEFIERLNIDNTQEITTKKLRPLLLFISIDYPNATLVYWQEQLFCRMGCQRVGEKNCPTIMWKPKR